MKKNKIIYFAPLMILLLVSVACSTDFLEDMKDYGSYDESIFTSETEMGWYIDNIFYDFYSGYNSPIKMLVGNYSDDKTKMTEEVGGTVSDYINPQKNSGLDGEIPSSFGSSYYGSTLSTSAKNEPYNRIRDCNYLLENIEEKGGSSLSSDFIKEAKGQMYYLRGIQYFDLMRTYGGVPIVTTVMDAQSEDAELPRSTTGEVVDQIIADLDSAATYLPTSWDNDNFGRPTKGAALAQKSRVLLTYASPLFNPDWDNTSNSRWAAALQAGLAAEAELTADGYGLYGSSAKDWEKMFTIDNSFCSEAICVQLCSSATSDAINNGWETAIRVSSQGGSGGLEAPKEMIDLFPMADGSRPTAANGYDDFLFFKNRDPRFYRTFAFSGCQWGHSANSTSTVWTYQFKNAAGKNTYNSGNNDMQSPAFVRKMTNTSADSTSFKYSSTDIFEYRYAELLLNIAECYAAQGNITQCISYLGQIRARVGIPSANNYGIGTLSDKYAAIEACLYERHVELAYEGKRFWDIQRWMLYNDTTITYSNGTTITNNTCAMLGLEPINGTCRTSHYLQVTSGTGEKVADDPLASARKAYSININSSTLQSDLNALGNFYTNNFKLVDPSKAWDNVSGTAVNIDWKQSYYVFGFGSSILTNNTWLDQTQGWQDAYSSDGTYDFQAEE